MADKAIISMAVINLLLLDVSLVEELTGIFLLQEEGGQQSLECIQADQIFPKKSPVLEEENMQVRKPPPLIWSC